MCYPGGFTSLQEANLISAIPAVNSSFLPLLTCNNNTAITLKPTTVRELENICSTSESGRAPSYDNIPMNVIKKQFYLISTPLMNIINLSIVKGIFPDKLKIANPWLSVKRRILVFLRTTDLFLYVPIFRNSLKKLCTLD